MTRRAEKQLTLLPRCYIAGPMTGIPGFNYRAFDYARDSLTADGWDVISPADLDRKNLNIDFSVMEGTERLDHLSHKFARQDIEALLKVERVYLLAGWQHSTGAMNEARIATMLGVECVDFVTGCEVDIAAPFSGAAQPLPDTVAEAPAKMNNRAELLFGAEAAVNGDRNNQYGDPRQDFQRTADLWNGYLGIDEIQPHDVAAMMALLKISRIKWSPHKFDSWMDLAGYAACGWDCAA